jgi:hypothetical protein
MILIINKCKSHQNLNLIVLTSTTHFSRRLRRRNYFSELKFNENQQTDQHQSLHFKFRFFESPSNSSRLVKSKMECLASRNKTIIYESHLYSLHPDPYLQLNTWNMKHKPKKQELKHFHLIVISPKKRMFVLYLYLLVNKFFWGNYITT